jgi:hypothetical protein
VFVLTLSKRQNGTVDPSLFSLHLIEGRVIPDWKKFISSGENIRFLGDYIAKHIRQNSSLQEGQSLYLAGLFSLPSIKCSENRLGSTVPFCLFDRVLNVISIKDIDDNGCKLKTRDLIFLQNQVPSHQRF